MHVGLIHVSKKGPRQSHQVKLSHRLTAANYQSNETKTKCSLFCKWRFQINLLQRKYLYLDSNLTGICPQGQKSRIG